MTCYLSVHMAKHTAPVRRSLTLLESLQLDAHNLGSRIDLELLRDVAVLLADVAVPLVITAESFLERVAGEARL